MSEKSFEQKWEIFFKPETRSAGRTYYSKGVVSASRPSDNQVQAYIKATTSFKVTFKSEFIDSEIVMVDCNCPQSKKGQLCKHIWATLLKIEERYPDFLESKNQLEKNINSPSPTATSQPTRPTFVRTQQHLSETQIASQEAYKKKQNDYRKEQYQKQKLRLKEQKQSKKKSPDKTQVSEFPAGVERALAFFKSNGFHMEDPLNAEVVGMAKKRLSRIFHPDIGGSHSEILELNKNFEIIMTFIKAQVKKG